MKKPLRILLAEDSAFDAEFVEHEIRKAYDPFIHRVEDAESMTQALRSHTWDVVISDYYMPGFGAVAALNLVREGGYDWSVVRLSVVSGQWSVVVSGLVVTAGC